MRVGLDQVDGKWLNLALMKISAWHKAKGDSVEWYDPLFEPYDRVYASKIFKSSPDDPYLPSGTIRGGTGYDLTTTLPDEVESMSPDYSIYPSRDYAIGFTTRGCCRNCEFCVVPQKEGQLKIVGDLYSICGGKKVVRLLDNNLTAAPFDHFRLVMEQAVAKRVVLDITQGLDLRLLSRDHLETMRPVRLPRRIHFAWDSLKHEEAIRRGLKLFAEFYHPSRATVYLLVGYDTTIEEDLYRINVVRGLKANPYVMAYDRSDRYQSRLSRWCNRPQVLSSTSWENYRRL